MNVKKKLLIFYDLDSEDIGIPLENIEIKIDEWINLLKIFPFFNQNQITYHVEKFKKCVAEINSEIILINGYILISDLNF